MIWSMLFYVTFTIPLTLALIAYDCGHERVNMTTLSLLTIEQCNIQEAKVQHENDDIQLLQLTEVTAIHVNQCKINVLQSIFRCGMFSHLSLVPGGFSTFIADISREKCMQIQQFGIYKLENGRILSDIKTNSSSRFSEVIAGSLESNGYCQGVPYTYGSNSWDEVIVMHALELTIMDYQTDVRLEDNNVILRNNILCPYLKGQCTDPEFGMTFWEMIPDTSCEVLKYDVLFQGIATKITKFDAYKDKIPNIMYVVQSEEVVFSLRIIKPVSVCRFKGFQTEHPRLIIVEKTGEDYWFKRKPIMTKNLDLFTYVNSKFIYVERHVKEQIENLYAYLIKRRCELEREVLQTQLTIAHYHPSEFALMRLKEPGYTAVPRGEIIYLIKCQPVEAAVRKSDRCYTELPVTYANKSFFMTPTTHLLQQFGTEIPCSSMMSPGYFLHGEWYGLDPQIHRLKTPQSLKPSSELEWKYEDPADLIKSGIYSLDSMDKLRRQIMFSSERHAITNVLSQSLMGHDIDHQEINMLQLFSPHHLSELADSIKTRLWSAFTQLGNISAAIFGIILTIRIIKKCIDVIINFRIIKSTNGSGWWMLGAFWNSMTTFLLHKHHQKENESHLTSVVSHEQIHSSMSEHINQTSPAPNHPGINLNTLRNNATLYPDVHSIS